MRLMLFTYALLATSYAFSSEIIADAKIDEHALWVSHDVEVTDIGSYDAKERYKVLRLLGEALANHNEAEQATLREEYRNLDTGHGLYSIIAKEAHIAAVEKKAAELFEMVCKGRVWIVWYQLAIGSHVGIVVDGKPYGFNWFGSPHKEPKSLKKPLTKVVAQSGNSLRAICLQSVNLSDAQIAALSTKLNVAEKRGMLAVNCIDVVCMLLGEIAGVQVPFIVRVCPTIGQRYLKSMHREESSVLGEQLQIEAEPNASIAIGFELFHVALIPGCIVLVATQACAPTYSLGVATFAGLCALGKLGWDYCRVP